MGFIRLWRIIEWKGQFLLSLRLNLLVRIYKLRNHYSLRVSLSNLACPPKFGKFQKLLDNWDNSKTPGGLFFFAPPLQMLSLVFYLGWRVGVEKIWNIKSNHEPGVSVSKLMFLSPLITKPHPILGTKKKKQRGVRWIVFLFNERGLLCFILLVGTVRGDIYYLMWRGLLRNGGFSGYLDSLALSF